MKRYIGNWETDYITIINWRGDMPTRRQLRNALQRMHATPTTKLRSIGVVAPAPCASDNEIFTMRQILESD